MTNPVDNSTRISTAIPANSRAVRADKAEETRPATGDSQSHVDGKADASIELSRLQQLRERIAATPDVNRERVEEIKQALAEGRLTFDPQRIAQKFIDLEGLLGD